MSVESAYTPVRPLLSRLVAMQARRRSAAVPLLGLALVYALLVTLRNLARFTAPGFYAEDGEVWFAGAHNLSPVQALVSPYAGYENLFARAIALLCVPLGLRASAEAYTTVAVIVEMLPALYIASARMRRSEPRDHVRAVIGCLYLLIVPADLAGNLTAAQWHLSILGLLVLFADPPASRAQGWFDAGALVVAGLSGPFALFLLPIAVWRWWAERDRSHRFAVVALAVCSGVQLVTFAVSGGTADRVHDLGASPAALAFIVANQATRPFTPYGLGPAQLGLAAVVVAAVVAVLLVGALRGPAALRALVCFAAAVAAAGLAAPTQRFTSAPAWLGLEAGGGDRYFLALAFAFVLAMLFVAARQAARWRGAGVVSLAAVAAVCATSLVQWWYPGVPTQHLSEYQAMLDRAHPGEVLTIPIAPSGWVIRLSSR